MTHLAWTSGDSKNVKPCHDDDDSLAHQAQEFSKRLQRLRDAAEVHKYEGSAKEVFSICLDLQALLTVFKNSEEEYELIV